MSLLAKAKALASQSPALNALIPAAVPFPIRTAAPSDPSDIAERAAIIAEGDKCSDVEAEQRAVEQSGLGSGQLAAEFGAAGCLTR